MRLITTRTYQKSDARALADIYYNSIHNINKADYSEEQINAWAPLTSLELDGWYKKWEKIVPIVACIDDKIIGFAEFEDNGHIDCFYVHHQFQSAGVGSSLILAIEQKAQGKNIKLLYAEVSITAKSFFIKKGFQVLKQQVVNIRGQELTNFIMEKSLKNTFILR